MGCVLCKQRIGGKSKEQSIRRSKRTPVDDVEGREETKLVGNKKRMLNSLPSTASSLEPKWSPALSFMASPLEWPPWLAAVAGDSLVGWGPRRADSFQKLSKGTYSNVYKAKDLTTGKIVALKKVRFDNREPESIKFMAREITLLRRLDHPNVIKLEGLVTSRVSCSLYLIFEYMEHDLTGLAASPEVEFTLPQIKCYMKQLLSGLEHCHSRGVLHRDIKCSNLLIDNQGVLKIADFGLAASYDPDSKKPLSSRVVTLWYRPPELILGETCYGVGVDLWSAGCILAEMLAKRPILSGRTEVEQLHRIFKLCGSPSDMYWKKSKLPHANMFKPDVPYKNSIQETFREFPPSSLPLVQTLLSVEPSARGTATAALSSEFFTTEPHVSEPQSLPHYPPTKELDVRLRDEEESRRRKNGVSRRRSSVESRKKTDFSIRASRAVPAPEANAELQINLNRVRLMARGNNSKSEKFPPPHQDGSLGFRSENHRAPVSFVMPDSSSFTSSIFGVKKELKPRRVRHRIAPSQMSIRSTKHSSVEDLQKKIKNNNNFHKSDKGKELQATGGDDV